MWKIMKSAKFVKNCSNGKCGILVGDKVEEMGGGSGGGNVLCIMVDRVGGNDAVVAPDNAFDVLYDFVHNRAPVAVSLLWRTDIEGFLEYRYYEISGVKHEPEDTIGVYCDSIGFNIYIKQDGNHWYFND